MKKQIAVFLILIGTCALLAQRVQIIPGSFPSNWSGSIGDTNSTLTGNATLNGAVVTNGGTFGPIVTATTNISVTGVISADSIVVTNRTTGYTIEGGVAASNAPGDGATYYVGSDPGVLQTAYTNVSIRIPFNGTIRACTVKVSVGGTLGSNETVAHSLRIQDTTDVSLGNLTYDAATRTLESTALSTAVTTGQYIVLKVVCPTWGTNPTNVRIWYMLWIQ